MFYFYVLYSLKDDKLYKGSSSNLLNRLKQHNAGRTKSTKHRRPLILLYFEVFEEKQMATQREAWSKTLEGGSTLRQILIDKNLLSESGKLNTKPQSSAD